MATARKPVVDPLVEELPPPPVEAPPTAAHEVQFTVEMSAYVVNGEIFYRWNIIDHNARAYIADYTGHGNSGFTNQKVAEADAEQYIERIRHTVEIKLNLPESYTLVF